MTKIKIPLSWVKDKGMSLSDGDIIIHFKGEEFLLSFHKRKNNGKQPVDSWVPVTGIANCGKEYNCKSGDMNWSTEGPSYIYNINTWKPNIGKLNEMYIKGDS